MTEVVSCDIYTLRTYTTMGIIVYKYTEMLNNV